MAILGIIFKKYWVLVILGVLLLVGLCGGYYWYWEYSKKDIVVEVYLSSNLPVVLVRTARGRLVVFDGGNDTQILREANSLLPIYRKNIDLVALSNPTDKRAVGLLSLIARYRPDIFLLPNTNASTTIIQTLGDELEDRSYKTERVTSKSEYEVDGIRFVFWPTARGLVSKFSVGELSFVMTNEALARDFTKELLDDIGTTSVLILARTDIAHVSVNMFTSFDPEKIILKKPAPQKKTAVIKKPVTKKKGAKKKATPPPEPPFSILTQKTSELIMMTLTSKLIFMTDGSFLKRVQ